MLALVRSATLRGIEATAVWVEVDVTPGLPSFTTEGPKYPKSLVGSQFEIPASLSDP